MRPNLRHPKLPLRLIVLAVLAFGLLHSCSKSSDSPTQSAVDSIQCGVERWGVKTLTDSDAGSVALAAINSSIFEQDTCAQVTVGEQTPRLAFERQLVRIPCTIVAFKHEDDSDIHLIITDDIQDTMIAEIPSVSCPVVSTSAHAGDYRAAAQWVASNLGKLTTSFKHVSMKATITGVVFQDFAHGQTGHSPNYREIHPVLKIE